jgi:long-chain acyl-CoA synthetase
MSPPSIYSWLERSKSSASAGAPGSHYPPVGVDSDDLATIIYTSGTTGNPKGVELSHANICKDIEGARIVHKETNIRPYNHLLEVFKDRIAANSSSADKYKVNLLSHNISLCFLPWSHVYGLTCELNILASAGGAMALVPHRDMILQCLHLVKPTVVFSVPMLFNKVYDGVQKTVATLPPLKQKIFNFAFSVARKRNAKLEFGEPVGAITEFLFQISDKIVFKGIREKLGGKLRYMASGGAATGKY